MTIMVDEDGAPIVIIGCAVPFNTPSLPIADLGGKCEIVSPTAFDSILADIAAGTVAPPVIDAKHTTEPLLTAASCRMDLWSDHRIGLVFRIDNIAATPNANWIVRAIASRQMWGCSMLSGCVHDVRDTAEGYRRVNSIASFPAITVTDCGYYGDAALVVVENQDHRALRNHMHREIAAGLHLSVAARARGDHAPLPKPAARPTIRNAAAKPTATAPQTITRITQDKQGRYHREVVPAGKGAR